MLSVQSNPACNSREDAERAVNEVWESCFNDTRPFDEVAAFLLPSLSRQVFIDLSLLPDLLDGVVRSMSCVDYSFEQMEVGE